MGLPCRVSDVGVVGSYTTRRVLWRNTLVAILTARLHPWIHGYRESTLSVGSMPLIPVEHGSIFAKCGFST